MSTVSFSGLASGIDGDAVIKATMDARRLATQPSKNTIEFNKKENTALEELNAKLLKVSDVLKDFRSVVGSAISKRGISSNDDAIAITASNAARTGSTTITVQNLAQAATFSFDNRFASSTTALGATGTLNLTLGSGTTQEVFSINATAGMTLSDLVTAINGATNGKITASAVNAGTESNPQFALVLNTIETGLDKGALQVSNDLDGILGTHTLSQAEDAIFDVSGLGTLTRSSNKVSGIIPGVTFELKQESIIPVALSVADDSEKTATKLDSVVGAINDLFTFIKENDRVERIEENGRIRNDYKDLAKSNVDDQVVQSIRDAIADSNAGGAGSDVQIFADLGLTTERDGNYKFDTQKFIEALSKDPSGGEAVIRQFADKMANTNGVIDNYTRFQGSIDQAITSNDDENRRIQDRLDQIEANLERQAQQLKMIFARLEEKTSQLNNQSNAIAGLFNVPSGKK